MARSRRSQWMDSSRNEQKNYAKCAYASVGIFLITLSATAFIVCITFIGIEAKRIDDREEIANCHYINSTILEWNDKYLFQGKIGGYTKSLGLTILYFYGDDDVDNNIPYDLFTTNRNTEEYYLHNFREKFSQREIESCHVDPNNFSNYRICYDNGNGGTLCTDRRMGWLFLALFLTSLVTIPMTGVGICMIVDTYKSTDIIPTFNSLWKNGCVNTTRFWTWMLWGMLYVGYLTIGGLLVFIFGFVA